jgi:7-cyano-7-deazaguanine synthase
MTTFGVTLLSGGLDSTTVTTYAKDRCDRLTALTFRYGQTHSKEVERAADIAAILEIEHRLLDISFLKDVAWYSALTNPDAFPIPDDTEHIGASIPITYVPLRNTIFLSLAAAFLESEILQAIEVDEVDTTDLDAVIYMAPNAIDYSGYPDCRPEFYEQIVNTLELGSKLGTEYGTRFCIETPIIHLSKAEIVKMGIEIGAPLEHTWSCYRGGDVPCGSCDSCILRAKGFAEAGVSDPALRGVRFTKNAEG